MTVVQQVITIGMVVLGTMITRFLPFVLFPSGRPTGTFHKPQMESVTTLPSKQGISNSVKHQSPPKGL